MALKDLKKNSAAWKQKLNQQVKEDQSQKKFQTDNRFWDLATDKAGDGEATIRFLPPPPEEDIPWVSIYRHSFKGKTGQWYIENCLSTIQEEDPVLELNRQLYATGDEDDKKQAGAQKRKLVYISNILVINDKANPSNNGKVFLFRYGVKLYQKIVEAMNVTDDDEEGINPFDPIEGADFKVKCSMVSGYRNYDTSKFMKPKPLFGGDEEKIDAILEQTHSLQKLVAPSQFKPYAELKQKLDRVLGVTQKKEVRGPAKGSLSVVKGKTDDDDKPMETEDEEGYSDSDLNDLDDLAKFAEGDED